MFTGIFALCRHSIFRGSFFLGLNAVLTCHLTTVPTIQVYLVYFSFVNNI